MSRKIKAAVSHNEREVAELRADRALAVEYLKAAMIFLLMLVSVSNLPNMPWRF